MGISDFDILIKYHRAMGYIESSLLPGERVVARARLHWTIFLKSLVVIAIGVLLLGVELTVGGIVIFVAGLLAVPPWITYATSEFGVTTKRVVIKVGVIRRRTLELLLRQVEAISVDQSIAGRILDFGSITLTGTGGVREVFHNIATPLEFRRQIQMLLS